MILSNGVLQLRKGNPRKKNSGWQDRSSAQRETGRFAVFASFDAWWVRKLSVNCRRYPTFLSVSEASR